MTGQMRAQESALKATHGTYFFVLSSAVAGEGLAASVFLGLAIFGAGFMECGLCSMTGAAC